MNNINNSMDWENEDLTIYQLFDCDDWRSTSSMDATSPIAVAVCIEDFAKMLAMDLEDSAIHLSEYNEDFFENLDKEDDDYFNEILDAYFEQRIEYRHVLQIQIGYNNN